MPSVKMQSHNLQNMPHICNRVSLGARSISGPAQAQPCGKFWPWDAGFRDPGSVPAARLPGRFPLDARCILVGIVAMSIYMELRFGAWNGPNSTFHEGTYSSNLREHFQFRHAVAFP